ncbi:MAG: DEAD/DEAH box helicase, partial [Pyrinomonadaceae bacterium]
MRRSGRDHREGKPFRKRRPHDGRADPEKLRTREKTEPPGAVRGGNYERELGDLLGGIGTPKPGPFKPDPFQLEALAALEFEDVLVTAPTGSGKTWIAREEIRRLLEAGKRAW